jgi:peroxiredoxin
MDQPRRSFLKPVAIGAVALVIGAIAYKTLTSEQIAPALTYNSIDGRKVTPEALKGKVYVVNFWATSCTTCVAEMPHLVETYNKFKGQGMEFIAVAMKYDRPDYVVSFAKDRQLPFTVAFDLDGEAARAFGDVAMTPTTFLVGKDGKILKRYLGKPDFAAMHQLIERSIKS